MAEVPWDRRAWRRLVALNAVALAGLVVSWLSLRSRDTFGEQEGWIVLAIVSLAVGLAGCADWLASALRTTRQLKRRTLRELVP